MIKEAEEEVRSRRGCGHQAEKEVNPDRRQATGAWVPDGRGKEEKRGNGEGRVAGEVGVVVVGDDGRKEADHKVRTSGDKVLNLQVARGGEGVGGSGMGGKEGAGAGNETQGRAGRTGNDLQVQNAVSKRGTLQAAGAGGVQEVVDGGGGEEGVSGVGGGDGGEGEGGEGGKDRQNMVQPVHQTVCASSFPTLEPATTARPVVFSTKDKGVGVVKSAQEQDRRRQGGTTREVGVVVIHPCIIL